MRPERWGVSDLLAQLSSLEEYVARITDEGEGANTAARISGDYARKVTQAARNDGIVAKEAMN